MKLKGKNKIIKIKILGDIKLVVNKNKNLGLAE
jgi:hypothetical protein